MRKKGAIERETVRGPKTIRENGSCENQLSRYAKENTGSKTRNRSDVETLVAELHHRQARSSAKRGGKEKKARTLKGQSAKNPAAPVDAKKV